MSRVCEVTGKKTAHGMQIARRGLAKAKGGVGLKTTGHTHRTFKPNIQKLRVLMPDGTVRRMKLSTGVIKSGKITVMVGGKSRTMPLVKALRGRNREHARKS